MIFQKDPLFFHRIGRATGRNENGATQGRQIWPLVFKRDDVGKTPHGRRVRSRSTNGRWWTSTRCDVPRED